MEKGNRERTRIKYSSVVEIKTNNGAAITSQLRDIGMESLYVYSDSNHPLETGEHVEVRIIIKGEGSKLIIDSAGKVTRIDNDGFAVVFSSRLEWWPVFASFPRYANQYRGIRPN